MLFVILHFGESESESETETKTVTGAKTEMIAVVWNLGVGRLRHNKA